MTAMNNSKDRKTRKWFPISQFSFSECLSWFLFPKLLFEVICNWIGRGKSSNKKWMYRVSHGKVKKVIWLCWGYRYWFLLIFWVQCVHCSWDRLDHLCVVYQFLFNWRFFQAIKSSIWIQIYLKLKVGNQKA